MIHIQFEGDHQKDEFKHFEHCTCQEPTLFFIIKLLTLKVVAV